MMIRGSRNFGDFCDLRVEAFGEDWIVGRDWKGDAHATTFESFREMLEYLNEPENEEEEDEDE